MYPKKMDIHVSKYPCIQVCMISKYPIIQVSKKNPYPRYACIRIYEKKWYPLIPNCGLVDAKIRASDKDLPVIRGHSTTVLTKSYAILTPSPPQVDKCGHLTYK